MNTRLQLGQLHDDGERTPISTDVIQQLDNNLSQWKAPKMFGLLVVLHKKSLNKRAWNAITNAINPIIVVEIGEILQVQQQIENIKWSEFPGKKIKRTRINIDEAEEIENVGEPILKGKRIKRLMYSQETIQY